MDAPGPGNEAGADGGHDITNETPAFVWEYLYFPAVSFLKQYGWFVILGLIVITFLWHKIKPHLQQWLKKIEDQKEYTRYKDDPDLAQRRFEAMEKSRKALQEQLDRQAEVYTEKQKEIEEKKRQLKIQDWDNHLQGKGYRSKVKPGQPTDMENQQPKPKKKNVYRTSDYNPLMGSSSGTTFRPPRRGGAGGG
ncbi:selenoprotein S [Lingula anatina]|uniref:Selenoprotein S n=1 Tax=Lingula anatina TaxID=7574 RepID=A0A1S3KFA0_LINAN|nr:selenoprotein S [Lingula anatina]|eukprot:XP_013420916.1 selenoprotein S [Lingula anatina]